MENDFDNPGSVTVRLISKTDPVLEKSFGGGGGSVLLMDLSVGSYLNFTGAKTGAKTVREPGTFSMPAREKLRVEINHDVGVAGHHEAALRIEDFGWDDPPENPGGD